ncbi:MAG TPA: hypothetical protein VEF04_15370 [Blastocatellia bacterium]|nr:hypothetical protein [Blastocatellia bacterium]
MTQKSKLVLFTVLTSLLILGVAVAKSRLHLPKQDKKKIEIVEKIKHDQAWPIKIDNREDCPIAIQSAKVKVISSYDFQQLTGYSSDTGQLVTFPEVELVSKSDKAIKEVVLALKSEKTGYHIVSVYKSTIPPQGSLKVTSDDWVAAERQTEIKDGKSVTRLKKVGLDSFKSWLPGGTEQVQVMVAIIEYENGQTWEDGRKKW